MSYKQTTSAMALALSMLGSDVLGADHRASEIAQKEVELMCLSHEYAGTYARLCEEIRTQPRRENVLSAVGGIFGGLGVGGMLYIKRRRKREDGDNPNNLNKESTGLTSTGEDSIDSDGEIGFVDRVLAEANQSSDTPLILPESPDPIDLSLRTELIINKHPYFDSNNGHGAIKLADDIWISMRGFHVEQSKSYYEYRHPSVPLTIRIDPDTLTLSLIGQISGYLAHNDTDEPIINVIHLSKDGTFNGYDRIGNHFSGDINTHFHLPREVLIIDVRYHIQMPGIQRVLRKGVDEE